RYRDFQAFSTDGIPHGVVIGQRVGKGFEAPDLGERAPAHRNRRSETWLREAEPNAGEHARKEMLIDRCGREARPESSDRASAIKAGNE
ncbi:hypothetical protein V2J23_18300, partial [Geobacillus thermoleovorans]